LAQLRDRCPTWEEGLVDSDEELFCQITAELGCACGFSLAPASYCEENLQNECLFQLGLGTACMSAKSDFNICMSGIAECNRDILRVQCLPEWQAHSAACRVF
jgi:hypothetical protein